MKSFDADIHEMIIKIIHKPISYLGSKSISKLRCFIDGFSIGYDYPHFHPFFPEFQSFIETKYKINYSDSWNNILLKITNDEEKAFDLFVEEFESFLLSGHCKF